MKRGCSLLLVSLLGLFSAGRASAEEATPVRDQVFEDVSFEQPRSSKMIELELKAVQVKCQFSAFSREGPSPSEVRACEGAVAAVARRGPSAIGPVLRVLDGDGTTWEAKRRLYDVLARTKDTRLIEPLIRGMARIATRKLERRNWEIHVMHEALLELSQAPIGETLPGVSAPRHVSQRRRAIDLAVDFRLWFDENEGLSHQQLVEKRTADELAHLEDADTERAYRAILYLLKQKNADAVSAGKKFIERENVPDALKRVVAYRVEARESEEKKAPSKAVKKVAKPAPAQPSKPPPEPPAQDFLKARS